MKAFEKFGAVMASSSKVLNRADASFHVACVIVNVDGMVKGEWP